VQRRLIGNRRWHLARCCAATAALAIAARPAMAAEGKPASDPVAEMRQSFTLDGKTIPPEIFRDFGDGDLADSGAIWVTVDVKAAIGSNLYYDAIKHEGACSRQTKASIGPGSGEETGYCYIGATDNGLLVVLASYNGGGSGNFITLHILDVALARGFEFDGRVYERVNLTNLRSVPLGDRWDGEISIAKNTIEIVTIRSGPADDSGQQRTRTIEAVRP
jgi:hypothetical protein